MKLSIPIFALLFSLSLSVFAQTEVTVVADGPTPIIHFEETSFDFGMIESGEKVKHVYTFTNTGDAPLVISNAKGSCGCTVPYWPNMPILPGESNEIEVQFDSKNKKGKQSKRITITANTSPPQTFLIIKGELYTNDSEAQQLEKERIEKMLNKLMNKTTSETSAETKADAKAETEAKVDLKKDPTDCFAIYPNPTTDLLQLDLKAHAGKAALIIIYNETGKLTTRQTEAHITDQPIQINVSNYAPGIYYASIKVNDTQLSTKCFVVAKK